MTKKISIRLTKSATDKARKPDDLRREALAAYQAAGGGDILCAVFKANGQQFALSSRMILEVEWLPNRVPARVLRPQPGRPARQTPK